MPLLLLLALCATLLGTPDAAASPDAAPRYVPAPTPESQLQPRYRGSGEVRPEYRDSGKAR